MAFARLKSNDEVVIVGAGGYAVELADLLRNDRINIRGVIDCNLPVQMSGLEYLGDDNEIIRWARFPFVIAIGEPKKRGQIFTLIKKSGGEVGTFIHSRVYLGEDVSVGEGVIIYPHTTVHSHVKVGYGALINSNCTIGHETEIGDFANIGPGASIGGRVKIGDNAYFGIGATTIENIVISPHCIIGAGAVVVRDCVPPGTYIGIPASIKHDSK